MKKEMVPNRSRYGRIIFAILSVLFILCVLMQVFFAGLAIFINPVNWAKHENFVHLFEFLPILMLITALIGRLPKWAIWQSAGLFGLIFLMYFTAHSSAILPIKYTAAAHPVIAMILFIISVNLTQRSLQFLKPNRKQNIANN